MSMCAEGCATPGCKNIEEWRHSYCKGCLEELRTPIYGEALMTTPYFKIVKVYLTNEREVVHPRKSVVELPTPGWARDPVNW